MTSRDISHVKSAEKIDPAFPEVISASRATDIPAFHSVWFMDCIRAGNCQWQNPYNSYHKKIVSFAKTEVIVFWSKNPAPLIPHLNELSDIGKKFYFQFTLNDYVAEGLEPGIPDLGSRIATFTQLAQRYKVVWRYDPVILGGSLTINRHLRIIASLMGAIGDCTMKLVFSFIDFYRQVERNLKRFNSGLRVPSPEEMEHFSLALVELRDKIAPNLKLATCAEADIDFFNIGIEKNSCIDPVLINELCGREIYKQKRGSNSPQQLYLLPSSTVKTPEVLGYEKDKGQRESCQCAPSQDIGSYRNHPCHHRCLYCYAGHARKSG